ncbi:MAG: hypothetical protein GF315_04410 [candidate division Zixibacteria bacterium]|nr:hypothetical protein [candidate division Zixibacteria bacterium]
MFSVVSWAIMLWKWRQFSAIESANKRFINNFRSARSIKNAYSNLSKFTKSPFSSMLRDSYAQWDYCRALQSDNSVNPSYSLNDEHFKIINDAAERAGEEELSGLSNYITFLATTANSSPFLGLLGTVWGIMGSFSAIGVRGSASLAVVAPGIAEALIATVAGLAAAIPAVIGYNHFSNRLRNFGVDVDNFKLELISAFRKENLEARGEQ